MLPPATPPAAPGPVRAASPQPCPPSEASRPPRAPAGPAGRPEADAVPRRPRARSPPPRGGGGRTARPNPGPTLAQPRPDAGSGTARGRRWLGAAASKAQPIRLGGGQVAVSAIGGARPQPAGPPGPGAPRGARRSGHARARRHEAARRARGPAALGAAPGRTSSSRARCSTDRRPQARERRARCPLTDASKALRIARAGQTPSCPSTAPNLAGPEPRRARTSGGPNVGGRPHPWNERGLTPDVALHRRARVLGHPIGRRRAPRRRERRASARRRSRLGELPEPPPPAASRGAPAPRPPPRRSPRSRAPAPPRAVHASAIAGPRGETPAVVRPRPSRAPVPRARPARPSPGPQTHPEAFARTGRGRHRTSCTPGSTGEGRRHHERRVGLREQADGPAAAVGERVRPARATVRWDGLDRAATGTKGPHRAGLGRTRAQGGAAPVRRAAAPSVTAGPRAVRGKRRARPGPAWGRLRSPRMVTACGSRGPGGPETPARPLRGLSG